jgi:PAS domain S-box-containing protein
MPAADDLRPTAADDAAALSAVLAGTAASTGDAFFRSLVEHLARALGTYGAWVTEYLPDSRRLRALAFRLGDDWLEGFENDVDGTPCEAVIHGRRLVHLPENVMELYPNDGGVRRLGVRSYMGVPLLDADDERDPTAPVMGHLAVLDTRPMPPDPRKAALFRIFAARAAAELRRLRAEAALRGREEKLRALVASAMDAIVELDAGLHVVAMNPAAERAFGCAHADAVGTPFARFLSAESRERLAACAAELETRPADRRHLWIAGGLKACDARFDEFPAEATLSRFAVRDQVFHTLILRNVHDRVEAERRIRTLSAEAEYLRAQLDAVGGFGEILGRSPALREVLAAIEQVAPTDASVLLLGETGTGKELLARALHAASARRDRRLVTVNCAAIPPGLIESEFFGHERGAFTGATQRRDGRFALADGGTILLDEVGELPLDVQAKLLRVLQEGEFEAVGSSRTRRVDVRVVAATNRDLAAAVREGRFREDLYYRLNVFPIVVPPLRERGDDVVLLADAFAQRIASRLGRMVARLGADDALLLTSYGWPGNVRELQNVVERAVITARDGRLALADALPAAARRAAATAAAVGDDGRILTAQELELLVRANIERALRAAGGRVAGADGAAARLGLKPSTLASRIKALGLRRDG